MSKPMNSIRRAVTWGWRHIAAGIALLAIVLAFVVGYQIASPAPKTQDTDTEQATGGSVDPAKVQMYTCSMHPSVRLPDPDAKCPICFMDLIPVVEGEGEGMEQRVAISKAAATLSRIETAPVARFFPTADVRLYGKVSYDETSVARLTAYFPARIERLFVNYVGVPVARGDHLAEVYSPELLGAFEELRQAHLALNRAEGMSELVRETTRQTLRASREKLRLFGVSQDQIDRVESGDFDSDRLTVYAPIGGVVTHLAVREGDYVETGAPIATVANLSRLWLDLEAYESQLPLLRWGQPIAFTVEAHPGEVFRGRISFIEPMVDERTRTAAVRVAVDNKDGHLKPGMFASAVVRPRVAAAGVVVSDELAGRWVGPMHPNIVKDGPGQCDICGMDLVPAESLGVVGDPAQAEEPLVIPRSAVLYTGTRSLVYVEVEDADRPTYESREVLLGPRAGGFYVVRAGLGEGERVVVNGAFRIDSAMQIAAKPSMMSERNENAADSSHTQAPRSFVFGLKPVYAAYLDAQEALADDDLARFQRATGDLDTAVELVQEAALVGEPLGAWRRAATKLRAPAATPDNLADARAHFERMSGAIIALHRRFGHHGSQTWHLTHCPMAFENRGADWIQRGTQINNPYFGASMLRCGEVREAFEPMSGEAGDE